MTTLKECFEELYASALKDVEVKLKERGSIVFFEGTEILAKQIDNFLKGYEGEVFQDDFIFFVGEEFMKKVGQLPNVETIYLEKEEPVYGSRVLYRKKDSVPKKQIYSP